MHPYHRGSGTGADGLSQLTKMNIYWIPSICNFANIDAALVDVKKHLHCPQYTIQPTHELKVDKLHLTMIGGIRAAELQGITDVHIYYTLPSGLPFQPPVLSAFDEVQGGVTYHIHTIYIDVASASSIDTSSRQVFPFLDKL